MAIFEKFEIALMNKKNLIIGKDVLEDIPAIIWLDMTRVVAFREAFEDDKCEDLGVATVVYMDSGADFWLNIPFNIFKAKLV